MPKLIKIMAVCTLLGLAGCAGMMRTQPAIGDPADIVQAKFGRTFLPGALQAGGLVVPLQGKRRVELDDAPAFRPRRRAEDDAERS